MVNDTSESGADGIEVSACSEKTCAMSGILHRIREGDELLVIVEGTAPRLLDHDRTQRGVSGTEKHLGIPATARGTGGVVPGGDEPGSILAGARGSDPEDLHHVLVSTGAAFAAVHLQVATGGAESLDDSFALRAGEPPVGVESKDLRLPREPRVVDLIKVLRDDSLSFRHSA